MRFTELLNRLTGISCPVFGVSWNPVDTERSIARRIIIFLEPRRVLYSAYDYESVCPCITSVTDIKNYLTSELLAPGENRHFEPGENSQFQPGGNRQSVPGGCSQPRFGCGF